MAECLDPTRVEDRELLARILKSGNLCDPTVLFDKPYVVLCFPPHGNETMGPYATVENVQEWIYETEHICHTELDYDAITCLSTTVKNEDDGYFLTFKCK